MKSESNNAFEPVHFSNDYYDGLIEGYANYNGFPCYFKANWDWERGETGNRYRVWRLTESTLALAIQEGAIWQRWIDAYKAGHTTEETHPALPDDRQQCEEIHPLLEAALASEVGGTPVVCKGTFRAKPNIQMRGDFQDLEVQWADSR